MVMDHSYVIGDFLWSGWDYLGECGTGITDYGQNSGFYTKPYPAIVAGCGLFDITGIRDTLGYYTTVVWGTYTKPFIAVRHPKHMREKTIYPMGAKYRNTDAINCWSFPGFEGQKTEVQIFSAGESVELHLNGKSFGKMRLRKAIAKFLVPYEPGRLEAISYDLAGNLIGRNLLLSASSNTQKTAVPEKESI